MDLDSHIGIIETRKFRLSKWFYKGTAIVNNRLWDVSVLVSEIVFVEVCADMASPSLIYLLWNTKKV